VVAKSQKTSQFATERFSLFMKFKLFINMKEIRKLVRKILSEHMSFKDLKSVDNYADELFSDVGVDIDFSDHFVDRLNDPAELNSLFLKAHNKYKEYIKNMPLDSEKVVKDTQTAINIPMVAVDKTKSGKVVRAKTIMRKKDFLSQTPILKV